MTPVEVLVLLVLVVLVVLIAAGDSGREVPDPIGDR
jgi:hypothetical protein